ncbi:hypothetical protein GGI25_003165 [Coemansia spiralis]|uniref:Gelsolin-like domain-containing protein n=1 Tax=Coemansia spiralis TaxID=417178 RepID=A0A9W8KXS3_9FUNG|nr:hypothetical protein GGI26_003698 [Coemansia sp. RSA 1358]KAJ2677410.1 hypothetical protein GGI25_003165 [Coemansia spiralis]
MVAKLEHSIPSHLLHQIADDLQGIHASSARIQTSSGSGVIKPFHVIKASANKWSRPLAQSRVGQAGTKNLYSRVRRKSPLCHDVLEFMLEGSSVSSQESLPLDAQAKSIETHLEATGKSRGPSNTTSISKNNTSTIELSKTCIQNGNSSNTLSASASPMPADVSRQKIHQNLDDESDTKEANISCNWEPSMVSGIGLPTICMLTQNFDTAQKDTSTTPSSIAVADCYDKDAIAVGDSDEDEDSSYDGWSDAGFGCDSEEGFDGQCSPTPVAASPLSTAKCSRSSSSRSSQSSDASDDSAATEPSLKWWKRRFRSSKPKSAALLRTLETTEAVDKVTPGPQRPLTSKSNVTLMPMLTKLRRSVSSKSAKNLVSAAPSIKRNSSVMLPPTKLIRAQSKQRPTLSETHAKPTRNISTTKDTISITKGPVESDSVARHSPTSTIDNTSADTESGSGLTSSTSDIDCDSMFKARWTLLKCKGMLNLHVVSVPTSISSLNHKDTFLFYPCVLRKTDNHGKPINSAGFSGKQANSSAHLSQYDTSSPRINNEVLLAQEYSRRKSICSLASRVIYVWIGAHSSAIKRDAIMRVAMEIRDKELVGRAAVMVVDESTSSDSARKKFFEQLFAIEHGTDATPLPKEMSAVYSQISPMNKAGDDIDFERALERRKVMYGFWESVPPATILSVGSDINASLLLKVPAGGVVVLDTWTDVFVWWRNEPGNLAVRQCAFNFCKMLIQDACIPQRPKSASVWHEVRGFEHVIFKTKFPDWPYVFASSMGTTQVVRQLVPAANLATPPAAVPIRSASRTITRAVAVA